MDKQEEEVPYNISNLSEDGKVYEVSFTQKSNTKGNRQRSIIEPVHEIIEEDKYIEKSVSVIPEKAEYTTKVIYQDNTENNKKSLFYRLIGKYFLCCH